MRVFVTGSKGFVGKNLVRFLIEQNFEVVEDRENVEPTWSETPEVQACFHVAAVTKTFNVPSEEMFNSNVEYPRRLFAALSQKGCKRFLVSSSAAVYGNNFIPFKETDEPKPLNDYAASKVLLEDLCKHMFADKTKGTYCALRYCNVYGPGEEHKGEMSSMVRQIALQILSGENPKLFQWGEQVRDYIHVQDVCRANVCALASDYQGVVNCGGGHAINFDDLTSMICRHLNKRIVPYYIPNPHAAAGRYQKNTLCDMSLAKKVINFSPEIGLEEGVKKYLDNIHEEFQIRQLVNS